MNTKRRFKKVKCVEMKDTIPAFENEYRIICLSIQCEKISIFSVNPYVRTYGKMTYYYAMCLDSSRDKVLSHDNFWSVLDLLGKDIIAYPNAKGIEEMLYLHATALITYEHKCAEIKG